METKIKGAEGIADAARLIKQGEVVAFATETVYGLGADAFNEQAVKKIFVAKGRPQDNPLIVHLSKVEDVGKVAVATEMALFLFSVFAPGPLTIVLKKKTQLPDIVSAGLDTVGIRIPKNKIARKLIEQAGTPIAAPSANTSMRLSPTTAQHVYDDLKGRIPLIIDGGPCEVGIESTVLDLSQQEPVILRPGTITQEMLSQFIPNIKCSSQAVDKVSSPGIKYKHYLPAVDCVLAKNFENAVAEFERAKSKNQKAVILGRAGFAKEKDVNFISLGDNMELVAKNLYRILREVERQFDYIIIEEFLEKEIESSVRNRLLKATQGIIV